MLDHKVKKMIHKLEKILKKDSRYKKNHDDVFKKQIKKIYTENKLPTNGQNTLTIYPSNIKQQFKDGLDVNLPILPILSKSQSTSTKLNTIPLSQTSKSNKIINMGNLAKMNQPVDIVDINTIKQVTKLLQEANDVIKNLL
jgi:hypothetical protein